MIGDEQALFGRKRGDLGFDLAVEVVQFGCVGGGVGSVDGGAGGIGFGESVADVIDIVDDVGRVHPHMRVAIGMAAGGIGERVRPRVATTTTC